MQQKVKVICTYPECKCKQEDVCDEAFNRMNDSVESIKPITPANAKQIAGDHYKQYGNLQPWDVIVAWNMSYLTGTALKYLARWRDKGGIDDLKKAIHFIEKQIEVAEAEQAAVISKQERYLIDPTTGEKTILPNS